MNLPSNARSLFAFGIFCTVAGAWLTFMTAARTRSLRGEPSVTSTAMVPAGSSIAVASHPTDSARSGSKDALTTTRARFAPSEEALGDERKSAAERRRAAPTEAERVAAAGRQLEFLELQEPENFLAIFDMIKSESPGNAKQLETARAESHRYIIARTRVLERMLRRFIDDPDADHGLETEALARLDDAFRSKLESLARDIPAVANLQEILTTTTLKAPAFTEQPSDESRASNEDVVD